MRRDDAPDAVHLALVAGSILTLAHVGLGLVAPARVHFVMGDTVALGTSIGWTIRLVLATAASLCMVVGPGLVLRPQLRTHALLGNAAFVWIPGMLALVATGLLAWLLASLVSPRAVSATMLTVVASWMLWKLRTRHRGEIVDGVERLVLVVLLLLLAIGVGRATWSVGPEGELYGGTISRTLEVGARSDSRVSFNAVQLTAHGDSPYGVVGAGYYAPYNFFARGPIAGLAAATVTLGGQAVPPRGEPPDQPWEPFDAQGFATYRIVMMLLNATVVLGVFGLLATFLHRRFALAGAALVAMSPFVVHEVYFTWPKLLAASFVLTASVAVVRRAPFIGGLLLGLGYLAHPSALFAVPAVALGWLVLLWRGAPVPPGSGASAPRWLARGTIDVVMIGLGVLVIFGSWSLVNTGHTTDFFTGYLTSAGGRSSVTFGDWLASRAHSLANTLVPLRLYLSDRSDPFVNGLGPARSPAIVEFSFLSRATLPFAVGILYFPMFLFGLARFARRAAALFVVAIVVPFLAFIVYWGANTTGVVREGMHAILVFTLIGAFLGHSAMPHGTRSAALVRLTATVRVLEVVFMVGADTVVTTGVFGSDLFVATDVVSLLGIAASCMGLAWITWRAFGPGLERPAALVVPSGSCTRSGD